MSLYRTIGIVGILLFTSVLAAQNTSLKQMLWDRVNPCYSMFEDMDEDGKPDYDELIDDSQNGYLKVSGSYPTCGCACSSTVGAYKDIKGVYTFLQTDTWSCEQTESFSASRPMEQVLPENFGLQMFIPGYTNSGKSERAVFYLKVEIPRYGTDTKVSLELVPFGINMISSNPIVYEFNTHDANFKYTSISNMVQELKDSESPSYLLEGSYEKINSIDKTIVKEMIGEEYDEFETMNEITECLKEMHRAFELYIKINTREMVMGWDKTKARFFVKEKKTPVVPISFMEFIQNCKYWGPAC